MTYEEEMQYFQDSKLNTSQLKINKCKDNCLVRVLIKTNQHKIGSKPYGLNPIYTGKLDWQD